MSQLNTLLESANPYKSLQSDAARLASKWSKTGLLEGLSEVDSNNMSLLLENQAKQLVTETSTTGGGAGAGTFTPGTGAQWAGVALPLVRKVFGQIAAKEFVSVQPMNLPSGLVFFLDFQYGTTKAPFTAGDSMYGTTDPAGSFGNTNTGGLYGAGRYSYSTQLTASAGTATQITASWSSSNYDGAISSSFGGTGTSAAYRVLQLPLTSLDSNYDAEAVRSFSLFVDGTDVTLPAYTKINGTNIEFLVLASNTTPGATEGVVVSQSLQPTDADRGDFEDGNTNLNNDNNPISIPQVNVQMSSEAIVAKTKKLKAVWTPEFAQDLNAYHSLDAEAELTSIMSEYISLEIDLEILDMLIESANAGTEVWSAVNNQSIAQDANGTETSLGFYNSQGQWFQTLGTKIQKVSNKIHQKTLRGGANFLVCSPNIATILESIPGYAASTDGDQAEFNMGVQRVGSFANRFKVYKNPYMTENIILMGYRGSQFLETGAVYAPYVPLMMTPLVYDPETFTPRKGLMTRYAKKMIRPEFYGKIYVSDHNLI